MGHQHGQNGPLLGPVTVTSSALVRVARVPVLVDDVAAMVSGVCWRDGQREAGSAPIQADERFKGTFYVGISHAGTVVAHAHTSHSAAFVLYVDAALGEPATILSIWPAHPDAEVAVDIDTTGLTEDGWWGCESAGSAR